MKYRQVVPCDVRYDRMKTDEQRGSLGAWARNARLAAGYPTVAAAHEAARSAGVAVSLSTLQGIEAGWGRPSRELVAALGVLYGSDPPVAPPAGDLASAFNALAAELREWRLEDRERIAELEAMVDSLYRAIRDAADSAAAGPRPDPLELHEPR